MFKKIFFEKIEERIKVNPNLKILDLGCGSAINCVWLLEKYPTIKYVGIEPFEASFGKAKENLGRFKNAEVIHSSAYDTSKKYNDFDLCYSLSVLEHVKHLEMFLENSLNSLKPGGELIHWYDLGHVLSPSSLKERIQGLLSKYFLAWLPESKVIRHIDLKWLLEFLKNKGVDTNRVTYHQMREHKAFLKLFKTSDEKKEKVARDLVEWEYKASECLDELSQTEKEKMFLSVCVWGKKL